MIFQRRKHPVSEESSHRDDFPQQKSSFFRRILSQGCFSTAECILFQKNPLPRMIFQRRNHPVSEECSSGDYFSVKKSSCFRRILSQGCFSTAEIILIQRNPLTGMIFNGRNHPVSEESSLRDDSMIKELSHKAPKASHSHKGRKHMKYIHIHPLDNVVVALGDLKKATRFLSQPKPLPDCSQQKPLPEFRKQLRWKEHPTPPSAVSSPSSTAAGRSRSSRMA